MSVATAFAAVVFRSRGTLSPPGQFCSPSPAILYFFLGPNEVGSVEQCGSVDMSLLLLYISPPGSLSGVTLPSVLLLVWAWTWIPRTMRKAEFKRKKNSRYLQKVENTNTSLPEGLDVCSEMGPSWLVWVLGADHGPWDIPRLESEESVLWRETSRHLPIGDSCSLNPQWLPPGSPQDKWTNPISQLLKW